MINVKLEIWHFWTESEIRCFDHEKKQTRVSLVRVGFMCTGASGGRGKSWIKIHIDPWCQGYWRKCRCINLI